MRRLSQQCRAGDNVVYAPNSAEYEVIKTLGVFGEAVKDAAAKYEPSIIARYAVELAQKYNKFYIECKILAAEGKAKDFRINLSQATLYTLENALGLLGIGVPEKM